MRVRVFAVVSEEQHESKQPRASVRVSSKFMNIVCIAQVTHGSAAALKGEEAKYKRCVLSSSSARSA